MAAETPITRIHSVAEAYLYAMTLACTACGKGPVRAEGRISKTTAAGGWRLPVQCGACGRMSVVDCAIDPPPTRDEAQSDRVNPTAEPSKAIDLLGWLQLFQSIIRASEQEADRQSARRLAHEAAQCLDEALKFYDEGEESPRESAFFTPAALARFKEHPEHFARSKWRQRRLMLPDTAARTHPAGDARRWWQFWRRERRG